MLQPYRRHTKKCLEELRRRDWNGKTPAEVQQEIKYWKFCTCPVWREGSYNRIPYGRTPTGVNNWKAAEKVISDLMHESDQSIIDPAAKDALTISAALERWHTDCQNDRLAEATMHAHRATGERLEAFCKAQAPPLVYLEEIEPHHIAAWRATWTVKVNTHRTQLSWMRSFFSHAVNQGWVVLSPMRNASGPLASDGEEVEDTQPLDEDGSDQNYNKVLAALAELPYMERVNQGSAKQPLREVPRITALVKVMRETGMRISDALRFDLTKATVLDEGLVDEVVSYTFVAHKTRRKSNRTVTTFYTLSLHRELVALAPLAPGKPFLGAGAKAYFTARSTATKMLAKAGRAAGLAGSVHPHRLRNQFAVHALIHGMRVDDVSRLLGHTNVQTTTKYYQPWVKGLADAVRAAYLRVQTPPVNVVTMCKSG